MKNLSKKLRLLKITALSIAVLSCSLIISRVITENHAKEDPFPCITVNTNGDESAMVLLCAVLPDDKIQNA